MHTAGLPYIELIKLSFMEPSVSKSSTHLTIYRYVYSISHLIKFVKTFKGTTVILNNLSCNLSQQTDCWQFYFLTINVLLLQVWSAVLLKDERYLVTGGMDQELKVWKLKWVDDEKDPDMLARQLEIVKLEDTDNVDDASVRVLKLLVTYHSVPQYHT